MSIYCVFIFYNAMILPFIFTLFSDAGKQPGMIWRMSSGLYNTATGAVGLGVGGVKWVVGVGSSVVGHVPIPGKSRWKTKDKSE